MKKKKASEAVSNTNPQQTQDSEPSLPMPPMQPGQPMPKVNTTPHAPLNQPQATAPSNNNEALNAPNATNAPNVPNPQNATNAPTLNPNRNNIPSIKRRIIEVDPDEVSSKPIVSEDTFSAATSELGSELRKIASKIDDMNIMNQLQALTDKLESLNIKIAARKPPGEGAIVRRAKALYYHQFKQSEYKVNIITNKAISAGFMTMGTKTPWSFIKEASDREFDALNAVDKKIYMDTARHMLANSIKVTKTQYPK